MKRLFVYVTSALLYCTTCFAQVNPLWKNDAFSFYADSIVQGKFVAKAISATEITSNYISPANAFKSPQVTFKFSINGKDNEMASGTDHHYNYISTTGSAETPLIVFGQQLNDNSVVPAGTYLPANTKLKIRVDMRAVLQAFKDKGYYTTFKGDKIYKEDFKGLYVAGNSAPLIWDFDNLVNHPQLQLKDDDGDGIYEVTLALNVQADEKSTDANWRLSKDISAFPQYKSDYPLSDAIYNMSLEEMQKAIETDSTFRTGKEWAGVWTRDISYSIILSMAYLQPKVAMNSLLRKVNKRGRIIQDTGTGGAWPVSTDRMIWAFAAWELYKATDDGEWLQKAYTIIKNSEEDDVNTCYDKTTGMVKGESSFLDWREQTYPKWMQPADIFESENLGTNAVHYQANMVLSQMAVGLGYNSEAKKYASQADKIKSAVNKNLWLQDKNYYAQYLYGRNFKQASPRSEALGEALAVLFDIASPAQQKQIISSTPLTPYGISCIYPQIPGIPPYHNNAVWPFVQTYWLWAAAKAGNEKAVMESISDIYRPAALFLTNKENFVADNGDFAGTQINSSNMLWSLSGNISIVHKVLFGIRFNTDGLTFEPFVPQALAGNRSLTNFVYHNAVLNITMEGYGNAIYVITMDGNSLEGGIVPTNITGIHAIHITLSSKMPNGPAINNVANYTTPEVPVVNLHGNTISWQPVNDAVSYTVYKNGKPALQTKDLSFTVTGTDYGEYQVAAVDKNSVASFASEPVVVDKSIGLGGIKPPQTIYEAEDYLAAASYGYKGFSGKGFIEMSTEKNTDIQIPVFIDQDGTYAIDCRYSNGNGPTNTENKCAIRTLAIDGTVTGTMVFPQRGKEEWSNWGYTNVVQVKLEKGGHVLFIVFQPYNENMNGDINQAMIDYVRVVRIK